MISRRLAQTLLGMFWLLDGLLQLKPKMFTASFVSQEIDPMAAGQPGWIAALITRSAHLIINHIAVWNLLFAALQLALGLAFMFNYRIRLTIVMSLLWCAIVWALGEGFGQMLTGQALLLTGAPGAVLIYGFIAIAVWPQDGGQLSEWRKSGIRFAQVSLAVTWMAGFFLQFQHSYLVPNGLSQDIAVPWLAQVVGDRGTSVSVVLALIQLGLACFFLFRIRLRAASLGSVLLSMMYWWAGQSFGQVLTPMATDFNSGLLMAVLSMCAFPNIFTAVRVWSTHERVGRPAM